MLYVHELQYIILYYTKSRDVEEINCNVKIAWDLFYLKNIIMIDDDRCNTPITTYILVGRIFALNLRINSITV